MSEPDEKHGSECHICKSTERLSGCDGCDKPTCHDCGQHGVCSSGETWQCYLCRGWTLEDLGEAGWLDVQSDRLDYDLAIGDPTKGIS